ncbi:MAG: EAL domain-containing protein [Azoarcus sp.]
MSTPDDPDPLRQAAEARLQAENDMVRTDHANQTRMVHELQVHQLELELQNRELLEARNNLEVALGQYAELYEFAPVSYFTLDRRGHILKLNLAAQNLLRRDRNYLLGKAFQQFVAEENQRKFNTLLGSASTRTTRNSCDLILVSADSPRMRIHVQFDVAGNTRDGTFRVVAMDVTDRKMAEEARRASESKFHALYSAMTEGMALHEMVLDDHGEAVDYTILEVNPAYESILQLSRKDVVGRLASRVYGVMPPPHLVQYAGVAATGEAISFESSEGPVDRIYSVSAFSPAANQFATVFADITAQRRLQQRLEHIAHFDALTALPNRVMLADRLRQAMYLSQRHEESLAVAYIDLDGFKAVNDSHGHDFGDKLLTQLAVRMKHALREGDTLARLGGDEFIAVMGGLAHPDASAPMLSRLLEAAANPFLLDSVSAQVSASIGVSFFPQADEIDADQLLRQADQAMYQAKLSGKNRYHLFDAKQDQSVRNRHERLEQIRCGMTRQEFVLFYQPKVNMRTGEVIGLEALIRWQHPEHGLLTPAAFLPVVEDHPLAIELGEWVIRRALTQIEEWREHGQNLPVSVNIGALQLQQPDFVARLRTLLAAYPEMPPGSLELEVLETSALQDVDKTSSVISTCRKMGVLFALDDFGTGYSSLTYLKKLPAEILKIDQSFVHDLLDDPEALAILEGVIGLAKAFQRLTIAEGLESVEAGVLLIRLGCELAQGYVIARPMPDRDVPGWVSSWAPDPRWAAVHSIREDNLPLLRAEVEHRAWLAAIEASLQDGRSPPPISAHPCRFGAWLMAEDPALPGREAGEPCLHKLHQQLHDQAEALILRHEHGEEPAALAPQIAIWRQTKDRFMSCLEARIVADEIPSSPR